MTRRRTGAWLFGLALLAGCSAGREAARPPPPVAAPAPVAPAGPQRIVMPEQVVTVSRDDLEMAAMDAAQLFDGGTRAFRAQDHARAARFFDRLADQFPESGDAATALYNAGLAYEQLHQWDAALQRWTRYLARLPAGAPVSEEEVGATFHAALAEHERGGLLAAAERLALLEKRPGLPPARRGEALVQRAVCLIELSLRARGETPPDPVLLGGRSEAEKLLRQGLTLYEKASADGEADPALLAQAEFWLGEIYRSWFEEVALDAGALGEKQLGEALESKAQFLLSAQGHYLRAIRKGDGEWATASGYRVGELYEAFYQQIVTAPEPQDLTAEQRTVYADELRKRVRVLIDRAMKIYEQTLSTAQRVGAQSDYVRRTTEALGRMRALLLAAPARTN